MANVSTALNKIDNESKVRKDGFLLPYQVRQAFSEARLRGWEKSIRIGATYEKAFEAPRDRLIPGKGDYLHSSVTQQVAMGFLEDCEFFLDMYKAGGAVLARNEESYVDKIVDNEGQPVLDASGNIIYVKCKSFEWIFDTKQRIKIFSSNPQALRGFGGAVGVDEIAFHVRMSEMLKAAGGRAMHGYPISLWSSHNGEDSEWNQFLLAEKRKGDQSLWEIQTTTLIDAIDDGLVEMINRSRGLSMTRENFVEQTKALLGSQEAYEEECLCMPKMRGLPAVAWCDILAARKDYTIDTRTITGDARKGQPIDPSVQLVMDNNPFAKLDKTKRYSFGLDIARNGHLTSMFIIETDGKRHFTALNIRLHKCKFPSQTEFVALALDTLPGLTGAGDSTGLGLQMCEDLADRYPGRFDMVNFSTFKPHIVGRLSAAIADGRLTMPREPEDIGYDIRGIKVQQKGTRTTYTETANPQNKHSHCDIAYSAALAVANAEDGEAIIPTTSEIIGASQNRAPCNEFTSPVGWVEI